MTNQPKKFKPRGRPIRPGEQLALKPESERKSAHIAIRVTQEQKAIIVARAAELGQSIKTFLLWGKI